MFNQPGNTPDLVQLIELIEKCPAAAQITNEFDALALFVHLALTGQFVDGYRVEGSVDESGTQLSEDWCKTGPNYYGFRYDLVSSAPLPSSSSSSASRSQSLPHFRPLVIVLSKLGTDIVSVSAIFNKINETSVFIDIFEYFKSTKTSNDPSTDKLPTNSSNSSLGALNFASSPADSPSGYTSSLSSSMPGTPNFENDLNLNLKRYNQTFNKIRQLDALASYQRTPPPSEQDNHKISEELEALIKHNSILKYFLSIDKIYALLSRINTTIVAKLNLPIKEQSTSEPSQSGSISSSPSMGENPRRSFHSNISDSTDIKLTPPPGLLDNHKKPRMSAPSGDLIPPGFDDEYQMNQAFRPLPPPSSAANRPSFPNIGSGDLNPPSLPGAGPRVGESSQPSSSRNPSNHPGMYPSLTDIESSFVDPDYSEDNSLMNPIGARWDPVTPSGPLGPGGPNRRGAPPLGGIAGLGPGLEEDHPFGNGKLGGNLFGPGSNSNRFSNGNNGGFGGGFGGGSGGGGFI